MLLKTERLPLAQQGGMALFTCFRMRRRGVQEISLSARPTDMGVEAELRILSGCHAGARAPLAGVLRIGADDDCDLIVSDMILPEDAQAWLQTASGRWDVLPRPADAANAASVPDPHDAWVEPTAWGRVARLGGIAITVSAPHAPWQFIPVSETSPEPLDEVSKGPAQGAVARGSPAPESSPAVAQPAGPSPPTAVSAPAPKSVRTWPASWVVGAALGVLLLGVLSALLTERGPARAVSSSLARQVPVDLERQQQMLRDLQLAIAVVDPTLRLQIEPLADGRARVSGWVGGVEQLDRLAEGLAAIRPVPEFAVRTASDLLDDLAAIGSAMGTALRFELLGSGRVQATGLVLTAKERDLVLTQLRERVPHGLEIVDALRVAEHQGKLIQDWLRGAGFGGASARWDDESQQIALVLDIGPGRRAALEALLTRDGSPLAGLPFTLRVGETAQAAATGSTTTLVHASAAPLPVRIRSVVGGPAPYVVLGDGSKLLPGGRRTGWRLAGIEPDRLVFEGPRRMVVLR